MANHGLSANEKQRRNRDSCRSPTTDIKEAAAAERRKRRSGVCLTMPCGESLPAEMKSIADKTHLNTQKTNAAQGTGMSPGITTQDDDAAAAALPQLQVNGKNCEDGGEDTDVASKVNLKILCFMCMCC